MRKLVTSVLAAVMCLQLCACDGASANPGNILEQHLAISREGYYQTHVEANIVINDSSEDAADGGAVQYDLYVEGYDAISHAYDMSLELTADGLDPIVIWQEYWQNGDTGYEAWSTDGTEYHWGLSGYELGQTPVDILDITENLPYDLDAISYCGKGAAYEICWPVTFADVAPYFDCLAGGLSAGAEGSSVGNLTASAKFDNTDFHLTSFEITSDDTGTDGSISLKITVLEIDGDTVLEIPSEIMDAVSSYTTDNTTPQMPVGTQDDDPNAGKWGQPGVNGFLAEIQWLDDGEDEILDQLAKTIAANDIGFNLIQVEHWADAGHLTYNSGSANEWNATMEIYRYDTHEDAMGAMLEQFTAVSSVYPVPDDTVWDGDAPVWTVFINISTGEAPGVYTSVLGVSGDMFMMCGGYDWTAETPEQAVANTMLMVDVTGLDWGQSNLNQ